MERLVAVGVTTEVTDDQFISFSSLGKALKLNMTERVEQ